MFKLNFKNSKENIISCLNLKNHYRIKKLNVNNWSYWEKNYWYPNYDITIIGSGIVGLSSALELKIKYPKKKIAVLERGCIPNGASTKNAGFACFGTVGEILDDLKYQSEKEVLQTIKLRWEGLNILKKNVGLENMDFQSYGGYEVFNSEKSFIECESQITYINQLITEAIGIKNCFEDNNHEFETNMYKRLIYNKYESQLNPVLLIRTLINKLRTLGVDILYSFDVSSVHSGSDIIIESINKQFITSKTLIYCTNAFANNLISEEDVTPARNIVLISKPIENLNVRGCFHYDKGYIYFRNIDNRLLIGGARNIDKLGESTIEQGINLKIYDHLKLFASHNILKQTMDVDMSWSGIIATGISKFPIVKQIKSNEYVAVRLGGMGVAIGSAVAKALSKIVQI